MQQPTFRLQEQQKRIGQKFGVSEWVTVTQDMIDQFGAITLDPDPMHQDPEWCRQFSPYRSTVAYGFLTMSLLTTMMHNVVPYDKYGHAGSSGYALNYGFDRVRLVEPVPVGSRVRAHFTLLDVRERGPGELFQKVLTEIEIENRDRPALVAEWLFLWITGQGHERIVRPDGAAQGKA